MPVSTPYFVWEGTDPHELFPKNNVQLKVMFQMSISEFQFYIPRQSQQQEIRGLFMKHVHHTNMNQFLNPYIEIDNTKSI